jgi:hypothetical protein
MVVCIEQNMVNGVHLFDITVQASSGVQEDRKYELSRHYPFDLLVFRTQIVP